MFLPFRDSIPTDRVPVVTIALIVANVLVYLLLQRGGWQIGDGDAGRWSLDTHAALPCDLSGQCEAPAGHVAGPLSVLTAAFMHGGLLHLGGNMLFLWIFGNNVEDAMGRLTFLAFYLAGGAAAFALQVVVDPAAAVPTVGASGAVAGVLGGYLVLYPRARVLSALFLIFFFTMIELPAIAVLALWFVQQVVFGALDLTSGGADGGGVAYFAHVGGFVFGMLVIRLLARPKPYVPAPYRVA